MLQEKVPYSFPFGPGDKYKNLILNCTKKGNILRFFKKKSKGNLFSIYYPHNFIYKILVFTYRFINKDE